MTADKEKPQKEPVDPKLSVAVSPNTVAMRVKGERRIGNRPLFIVFIAGAVIVLTLGYAALNRSNTAKADIRETGGKSAQVYAKEFIGFAQAGVVPPKEEPLSQHPSKPPETPKSEPAPEMDKKDVPPPRLPEPPKPNEEMRRAREKRLRQFEAALDGPIKAQIDEMKPKQRAVNEEIALLERQIAALNNPDAGTYADRLASIKTAVEETGAHTDYSRNGDLSRTRQFGKTESWSNPAGVEAPATPFIIRTGSVIPATLISGINSDLPGQIVGQVAQDVYDTPTGRHVLIPQGSRLVGEYSSQVQYGQSRVFAVWQRIVFPDGKALDLGAMPGSSGAGYAGFRDRVNNHYIRIFGSAIMMSAILAGVEMTQNNQGFAQGGNQQRMADALSESLGQVLGGVMAEMLQKNMNIAPTLEIRPGYRLNVMLVKDLEFKGPYAAFDYPQLGK